MTLGKKRFDKFADRMKKMTKSSICDRKERNCVIKKKCSDINLDISLTIDLKEGKRRYPLEFHLNELLQKGSIIGLSDNVCVVPIIGTDLDSKSADLGTIFMEKYYVTMDMSPVIERGDHYTIVGFGQKEENYPYKIRDQYRIA